MKGVLRIYPRTWRDRYGAEFEALLEASGGGFRTTVDVVRGALDARLRQGGRSGRRLLPWLLLVLSAGVIGWLNVHTSDDVQPVAGALIVAGFGFGLYRPRRAWLYASLLFVAVPLSGAWADVVGYHPAVVKPAPLYETVIALIPVALGACAGAGTRWLLRAART